MSNIKALCKGIMYIEANIENSITISEVANYAGYSQFHYSRMFSQLTHCSIYDYIMKRKLSLAFDMLLTGDRKIVDVAFCMGFNSHESFSRAFKKLFGVTPSKIGEAHKRYKVEAFNQTYLEYLSGVEVVTEDNKCDPIFFIGNQVLKKSIFTNPSLLVLKDNKSPYDLSYVLEGIVEKKLPTHLHYHLESMLHIYTIRGGTVDHVYRLIREILLIDRVNVSNYILILPEQGILKVLIPIEKLNT